MNIVKTFSDMESIVLALNLMLDYPFNERPLLLIKTQLSSRRTRPEFIEGTLDYIRGNLAIIRMPYNSENNHILLDTIVDLHIYDEGCIERWIQ